MSKYQIREKLNTSLLDNLLHYRGIDTDDKKRVFLNPDYSGHLLDPFLLKDAEKAARRIIKAIENNEKILIYSDYDADGIPAGVIFHDFLRKINYNNFSNYIPHRHDEGFGLNIDAVKKFHNDGIQLIITLDCGISDIEAVSYAQDNNIDVIITDHHEPHEVLPNAYAIVDHKQKGCAYPEKNLCGAGVGYKLIQAILKINRFNLKDGHEKWFLDMVGIATLSDMVPLTGENRVLAYYGLKVLRMSPRKGFIRLINHLNMNQRNLNEDDVGFMITPRINAASRMGIPMDAFRLLSTNDDNEAHIYVAHLDKINNERKGIVASIVKEIKKIIEERAVDANSGVIVIGNPEWRPSLLGLAANTIAEEYGKPAFLWGRDGDGIIKGSCRSGDTVSVVEIMNKVKKGVLLQFGGHFASGGFSVSNDHIHNLSTHLEDALNSLNVLESIKKPILIDMEITLDMVNMHVYSDIEKMAPFGMGNEKPKFIFKNIKIAGIKKFGKEKNHLELSFDNNRKSVKAIGFFMNPEDFHNKDGEEIKVGDSIDLIANMEKSLFGGRSEIRLRIIDII